MRRLSSFRLGVLAWLVLPAHAQQSALPATATATATATAPAPAPAPAIPPVGQGPSGDWAFIGRYRDADQSLAAKSDSARVVFMGDSITEGWAREPFISDNPHYAGRGISGQTAAQMLVRFRSDVIALKPALVHIMAGTNDVAQNTGPETPVETQGYIKSMVELALASKVKVILASIPPAKDFYWHRGLDPSPKILALNEWIKGYAASLGLAYVDYWSVLATPEGAMKPEFSMDGVHPNSAGYEAMRPLAESAIAGALKRP